MVQITEELQAFNWLHQIVFEGSPRIETAIFSPDGSVVHVQMTGEVIDLWPILLMYWPYVGGTLLLVVAMVVIWRVLRVRSSPERAGAWLCRRCRYEVSPLVDDQGLPREGALCSECGRALGKKRVRMGRSTRRRLAIPVTVMALVGVVFILGLLANAGVIGADRSRLVWPSVDLAKWARDENSAWLIKQIANCDRIVDIDFQSGEIRRDRYLKGQTSVLMLLSEDGRTLYRIDVNFVNNALRYKLEALNLASGRVQNVADLPIDEIRGASTSLNAMVGFTDGGSALLVVGRLADTQVVLSVDLRSGEVAEIIREPAIAQRGTWSGAVGDVFDAKRLVLVSGFSEMYETKQAVIRAYDLGETVTPTATHTFDSAPGIKKVLVSTGAAPVLFPDGRMLAIASGDVTRTVMGIDLDSGAYSHLDAPIVEDRDHVTQTWDDITLSQDGKWMVLASIGSDEQVLFLRDTASKAWVARLWYPYDIVRPVSVFSRDGKRLASMGFKNQPGFAGNTTYELFLYDLSKIPAVQASE